MEIGKILIMAGFILMGVGVFVLFLPKIPGLGKLPGDIFIKKDSFIFYFPFATSVLFSIVLSILFYFLNRR